MHRHLIALAATALVASACTAPVSDRPTTPSTPSGNRCDPRLADGFQAWSAAGFSGTVAISTGGAFDCVAGFGEADRATGTANAPDTVYSIGSVSKAFTAAAIYALVDEGALRLNVRAGRILPALRGPAAKATVRRLLLHTSGLTGSIAGDHVPLGHDAAVRRLGELKRAFPAGSRYLYSNAGYTLLALIVQRTSGESYREFLASRVLRLPAGGVAGGFWDGEPAATGPRAVGYLDAGASNERGHFAGPYWALAGNGDLAMSTEDLATWTYALFTGRVVSQRSAAAIAAPGAELGNGRSATPGWVAFDKSVYGESVVATSGGGGDIGHNVVVAWLPESERVIAIASNTPRVPAEELLKAIAPSLVSGDPIPAPQTTARDVDPDELAAVAGRYRLRGSGAYDVDARDDGITISAHGADAVEALFPIPDDIPSEDVDAHEEAVRGLLAGDTQDGERERAAFESDFGDIDDIELAGTIVADGELRTYATITTTSDTVTGWYALDDAGAISAAEVPTDPPSMPFLPVGTDRYLPDDPTGDGPDVGVRFGGRRMTITGPAGMTSARRSG